MKHAWLYKLFVNVVILSNEEIVTLHYFKWLPITISSVSSTSDRTKCHAYTQNCILLGFVKDVFEVDSCNISFRFTSTRFLLLV